MPEIRGFNNKRGVRDAGPGNPAKSAAETTHPDASWSRPGSGHIETAQPFYNPPLECTLGRDHSSSKSQIGPPLSVCRCRQLQKMSLAKGSFRRYTPPHAALLNRVDRAGAGRPVPTWNTAKLSPKRNSISPRCARQINPPATIPD